MMKSKHFAFALIKELNQELANTATEQEKVEICEEQDNVGVLLAFLWASEQGLLAVVTLLDVQESPHLNHQCKLIVQKVCNTVTPQAGTSSLDPTGGLVIDTQSLMISMQKTESTRLKERAEDKKP